MTYRAIRPTPVGPTPERLAKGDVEAFEARDYVKPGARTHITHRARREAEPIRQIRSLSPQEIYAGLHFGRVYRRATATVGAIDYADLRTTSTGESLTHARCEALSELRALWACLADTPDARNQRFAVLKAIAGERRTMDDFAGKGGRRRTAATHMLISCCQRIERHLREKSS